MRIAMIGTGYVGLVSGTCFAEFGHEVICVDKDAQKIAGLKDGIIPIYEDGLEDIVVRQYQAQRLHFTTHTAEAVSNVDAVFIAVGTPPRPDDGQADLSYVYAAAREIARHIKKYTVIVNKSTVPVGTAAEVERIMREENPNAEFDIVSNPEFLREGVAVNDFMRPERIVVGHRTERAKEIMAAIYRPLNINETPIVYTDCETSEIIKYAANAFLATKITFINEIANLCEKAQGDVMQVAKAIGLDSRIGAKFLQPGPGYGGSCFPKDTLALAQTGQILGARQHIVEAVINVNNDRQAMMAERIIDLCQGTVMGKKIAILGVSFKPMTDDVRDAPSTVIVPLLQKAGAKISAYDPVAMDQGREVLNNVEWASSPYEAAQNADAIVIITEWNEFRSLDFERLKPIMNDTCLIDLRNVYKPEYMAGTGFRYISIGRPVVG
jgi:UDPglucose 6-dehydrogenase